MAVSDIPDDLQQRVAQAIRKARTGLQWKPGKAEEHLAKRIERGHLPPDTTLEQYEAIIRRIVSDSTARVYIFRFGETDYPTIVSEHAGRHWLVMFNMGGILETAFPPDDSDTYFREEPRYVEIGNVEEILA